MKEECKCERISKHPQRMKEEWKCEHISKNPQIMKEHGMKIR